MIKSYTPEDVKKALVKIGITQGDSVFIHSNLGFLGLLDDCKNADELCEGFLAVLLEIVGERGTIIVPTFSYSFCHGELFDPYNTPTKCGMLANYILKKYPNNRSLDPNFSICGIGRLMKSYRECNIHESFGQGSFWELLLQNKGKIMCINFDAGSTFVHYIERKNDVNYRYNKSFNGIKKINGNLKKDYAVHFVFDGDDDAPAMERVDLLCRENGICRETRLGKGTILAFEVERYYYYFSGLLKNRPRVLCAREEMNEVGT